MTSSTEVLLPNGAVRQSLLANSRFLSASLSGYALQIRGITDTNGGFGGGTLYRFDLGSAAIAPLTTTAGGSPYVVPSGEQLYVGFLSNSIGTGEIGSIPPTSLSGAALDLSALVFAPIEVANTQIIAFGVGQ